MGKIPITRALCKKLVLEVALRSEGRYCLAPDVSTLKWEPLGYERAKKQFTENDRRRAVTRFLLGLVYF